MIHKSSQHFIITKGLLNVDKGKNECLIVIIWKRAQKDQRLVLFLDHFNCGLPPSACRQQSFAPVSFAAPTRLKSPTNKILNSLPIAPSSGLLVELSQVANAW